MARVEWTDDMVVEIRQFDEHHRYLYVLLDKVYSVAMYSRQAALLKPVAKELAEYCRYHFHAETELMRQFDYPDRISHEAEHHTFVEFVGKLERVVESSREELVMETVELAQFLAGWLTNHIQIVDKEYARYLRERGVN